MKRNGDEPLDRVPATLSPADFDGHSDFKNWTPEQRLDWLGQVIAFVHEFKGAVHRQKQP